MKFKFTIILALFAGIFIAQAQDIDNGATYIGEATLVSVTPSIQSRLSELTSVEVTGEALDGRSKLRKPKNPIVPGKGRQEDYLSQNPDPLTGKIQGRAVSAVWDAGYTGSNPTDPALAVGPDHVFVVWNTAFAIFDKDGNELLGNTSPNPAIFPSDGCCDLTVSYDSAADRWVVSFLGNGAQIAVSQTGDPLTTDWNIYNISTINDYNKLSVWSDGYYMTDQANGNRLYAMDRAGMLAGNATVSIQGFTLPNFSNFGFASPQALNVTDDNMPAAGNAPIVFFQDDAYTGVTVDHIKFWTANVDFDTPGNSTMSAPQEIPVTPFTSVFDDASFQNLTQPNAGGGTLDALQGIIMNQAQFRKFATHNSAVFNHVIDTDPSASGKRAAIRWYEFRQVADGAPWTLYQEGTYEAPDNKHAWNASLMMDGQGNIGMGYTGMSIAGQGTVNVSSYYTGRFVSDPINTMTVSEEPIVIGDGVIVGSRYGDYSKIDIDHSDDQTFYFANEVHTVDTPNNQRAANVGRFKIAPDADNDTGIVAILTPEDGDLTSTETVSVMVRNYGTIAQSNIPVSFSVDGGLSVSEVFTGTIPPASNAMYTFTATADLSTDGTVYNVCASTGLVGDEIPTNDEFCMDVTHLNDVDTGVISVNAPETGTGLGNAENITVTIQNFGAATQTSIPVFYMFNGAAAVMETYTGSIAQGETDTYTFTATEDFSALGDYTIVAGTDISGDADTSNDDTTAMITNFSCQPGANCTLGDGIRLVQIGTIDNASDCETDGYGDFTSISTDLGEGNEYDLTITTEYGNQFVNVWIDFNDNNAYEAGEAVLTDWEIADGQNAGSFTETTQVTIPAGSALGMHSMRIKTNWNAPVPADPCEETTFGETEDYSVNIVPELGIEDQSFASAEFIVTSLPDNKFELHFNTSEYQDDLPVYVTNMLGQDLAYYVMENTGNGYSRVIDMSYVSAGVYFFKVGAGNQYRVQRVIVK